MYFSFWDRSHDSAWICVEGETKGTRSIWIILHPSVICAGTLLYQQRHIYSGLHSATGGLMNKSALSLGHLLDEPVFTLRRQRADFKVCWRNKALTVSFFFYRNPVMSTTLGTYMGQISQTIQCWNISPGLHYAEVILASLGPFNN